MAMAPTSATPVRNWSWILGAALVAVTSVVAIQHRLQRSETATGRLFWHYVSVAFGLWLLTRFLDVLLPESVRAGTALWVGFLSTVTYLVLAMAAEVRPERGAIVRPREPEELASSLAVVFFMLSVFVYLAAIPAWKEPGRLVDPSDSILLQVCLGGFLTTRFAFLQGASGTGRWRTIYRLLCAAFAVGVVLMVAEWLLLRAALPVPAPWRVLSLLPLLTIIVGARLGRQLERVQVVQTRGPRAWEPLAFYAIALPLLHLLLDYFNQLPPDSWKAQQGMVILYFVAFGSLALAHSARYDSRRRQAETALRTSERRHRRLIESHPDLILIEQDGRVVFANDAARDKLDVPPGVTLADLGFPTLDALAEVSPLGSGRPGTHDMTASDTLQLAVPSDCRIRQRDGETMNLEIAFYGISYAGREAVQLIARDVTEVRRRLAESERTARLATLGKISAAMAHEIRNPLAAIVMHCFFLADRLQKDDENLQILADINVAVDRMQKLVTGILTFVRPSELRPVEEDLVDVIDSALATLLNQVDDSKVEIVRDSGHQTSRLELDVNQMIDVFTHIFDNAVRAMPDGGQITIRTRNRSSSTLEVVVEDTGVGIGEDDLQKIFEPFFARRDDGIGLGLAQAARTLDAHVCSYHVESELGEGTRFHLSFALDRKLEIPPHATAE